MSLVCNTSLNRTCHFWDLERVKSLNPQVLNQQALFLQALFPPTDLLIIGVFLYTLLFNIHARL
jgi:hypothetical protein